MRPVAIVIPWFGPDQMGGAEQQALQIAKRLVARGHAIEVLTTCNRSFQSDWSINHHAPGVNQEGEVKIRRFPVDPRDSAAFDQVNAKLLALENSKLRPGVNPVSEREARTFVEQNIKSAALLDYLRAHNDSYHAFIFMPYMFSPVMLGVPLVAERAWLQPCLHDEAAAYLPQTAELFRRVGGLLFNSEGELELALRLFGPGIYTRSSIVGEGIEPADLGQVDLPGELQGVRYVLYLGRRERVKNVDLLVRAFARFKETQRGSTLRLVLAGPGSESFASTDVLDLGLVSDAMKNALLASACALAQPSQNESYSRTMMESWATGRPVAVHRECLATATAVERARGGWTAATEAEWAEWFGEIAGLTSEGLKALGENGRAYAACHADWDLVMANYEASLGLDEETRTSCSPLSHHKRNTNELRAIHQLLPDIVYGDAISNQAFALRDHLREAGYQSDIFVKRCEERLASEVKPFADTRPGNADGLIYHHSIGSELTTFAVAHSAPKCLVYHNITPAEYYAPYRPGFAWMLEMGRAHLRRLGEFFPISVADSSYNAAELAACGFPSPGVLPIIIDPEKWNIAPDPSLIERLQDGRVNLLFVGRIAPNKKQDKLVSAFAFYRELAPEARLILVGEGNPSDPYFHHLRNTIAKLDLVNEVELTGQIDDAALLAYYRTAHLYWSASEHEGFGAPLVEAMWFDVPVLALDDTAVPETLSGAGFLYPPHEALRDVAARAYQLTHKAELRKRIIVGQRGRRNAFTPVVLRASIMQLIEKLTAASTIAVGT
ncbi:MAG TPA: glycosyltransferase [Pyrinomonadaceae bacterium]|nr:glycosyltransferase [Pyrinomonadaceae bacterium]